jgi:hypothetical protein
MALDARAAHRTRTLGAGVLVRLEKSHLGNIAVDEFLQHFLVQHALTLDQFERLENAAPFEIDVFRIQHLLQFGVGVGGQDSGHDGSGAGPGDHARQQSLRLEFFNHPDVEQAMGSTAAQ